MDELVKELLSGQTAIFLEGCGEAILLDSRKYEMRPVMNPRTEAVVIGSQEGFVENLRTNLTLVRRYLRSPELITEFMDVGTKISTRCAMVYLDGVANETVVNRVREKIAAIGEAHVLNCGSLAQLLEPRPFLIFRKFCKPNGQTGRWPRSRRTNRSPDGQRALRADFARDPV